MLLSNKKIGFGIGALLVFVLLSISVGILPLAGPWEQHLNLKLSPPSFSHPLGTDDLGRDILSRVLYGTRISLGVAFASVCLAIAVGVPLGAVPGYYGGAADALAMRVVDAMMAFPSIILAVAIVASLGPSLVNVVIAVGIVEIPLFARQVRVAVLQVKQQEFILASRSLGASELWILLRHVLPNCVAPLAVVATFGAASAILDAAGLSFLGLGAEPGTPEWGTMLSESRRLFLRAPWVWAAPGMALMLFVLSFNLIGDGLQEAFNPRKTN